MLFLKQLPLKVKLLILFIAIGIGSMIAVSVYYFKMNEKAILERTFEQLTSVRVVKKRQLEAFFKDRVREINLIASSSNVKEIIYVLGQKTSGNTIDTTEITNYTAYLNHYLVSSGYFNRLLIIDSEGNMFLDDFINDSSIVSFTHISQCEDAPVLSEIFSKRQDTLPSIIDFNQDFDKNNPGMYIVCRNSFGKGHKLGLVLLQVSLSAINDIMLENSPDDGLGHSGESYLVGSDFLMRSTSRFAPNSVLHTVVPTESAKRSFKGLSGIGVISDYRGVDVFSSYGLVEVDGLNWAILAEMDYKEAMLPLYTTRNDILYISILLSIIIIGLSAFFSSHIIAPIRKLKEAVVSIELGNYDVQVPFNNNDEVGRLVMAFNSMAKTMSSQTRELKNREERLSHFYTATTDGIFLHRKGVPMLVNKALEFLTGFSESQLMSMTLDEIIQCKNANGGVSYETVAMKVNGDTFPVEIQQSTIDFKGANIEACVIRDITRRKTVETALEYERKQRLSAVFDGQEQERQRLSRELHDGLGQRLIALKMFLESADMVDAKLLFAKITETKSSLDEIISEIRQISGDIMPLVLIEFGLERAISQLCKSFGDRSGINVMFHSDQGICIGNKKTMMHLYRIAQEAVANAVKHAHASNINVQLIESPKHITLIIEDNGCGFDIDDAKFRQGNGIYNMRERIRILNGRIDILSNENTGTLINARIEKENQNLNT